MLVSIITITFNSEKHLEQTIQSVIGQDYPDIEYIIVDGGSTGGTLDIIKKYEKKIAKWVSEPDKGIADAMNKGIRMASGGIIGIIHSDDYYEPGAISAAVKAFEEHPGIGVVHGDLRMLNVDGGASYIVSPPKNPASSAWEIPVLHSTVFVRKAIYDRHGVFDLSYRIAMDHDLFLRYIKNGVKFHYINRVIAAMRLGGLSYRQQNECVREKKRLALHYGYNRLGVYGGYLYRISFIPFEQKAGLFLRKTGFSFIAKLYRRIFYPGVPKEF